MTDNEIIKALECCENADCTNCPCYVGGSLQCMGISYSKLHDLFIRQKAEIENLRHNNRQLVNEKLQIINIIIDLKSKAIKEFAERLKDKSIYVTNYYDYGIWMVEEMDIDKLVDEMADASDV